MNLNHLALAIIFQVIRICTGRRCETWFTDTVTLVKHLYAVTGILHPSCHAFLILSWFCRNKMILYLYQIKRQKAYIFPCSRLEDVSGSTCKAPLILKLGALWISVINIIPRYIYSWDKTLTFIDEQAGWDPESEWTFWRREKYLTSPGVRTQDRPVPISIYQSLSVFTSPYQHLSVSYQHLTAPISIYQSLSAFTSPYQHLPVSISIYQSLSAFTSPYQHLPVPIIIYQSLSNGLLENSDNYDLVLSFEKKPVFYTKLGSETFHWMTAIRLIKQQETQLSLSSLDVVCLFY